MSEDWLNEVEPLENADWLSDETTGDSKAVTLTPTWKTVAEYDVHQEHVDILKSAADQGLKIPDREDKRLELAMALRALSLAQRVYLNALIETGFVQELARKKVRQVIGTTPSFVMTRSWERSKKFVKAMTLVGDHTKTYLDPVTNMIRLDRVIQATLTPRDRYAGGENTGEQEIAAGEALRGIELAAKINKQLGADAVNPNRVTVIINLADDKPEGAVVDVQ